jgi:hypothetical protein
VQTSRGLVLLVWENKRWWLNDRMIDLGTTLQHFRFVTHRVADEASGRRECASVLLVLGLFVHDAVRESAGSNATAAVAKLQTELADWLVIDVVYWDDIQQFFPANPQFFDLAALAQFPECADRL